MALAFKGNGSASTANSATANQTSLVLTTATTAGASGDLAVLCYAVDNHATGDGDEGALRSVTDSGGNTWIKAAEWTNGQGTIQAGATCGIWYSNLTAALAIGGTVTLTWNAPTSARDASAANLTYFTKTSGMFAVVEARAVLVNDAALAGSLNATTANIECLRIRAIATESATATALTKTAAFTAILTQAVASTAMAIRGEYLISTSTGQASAPTGGVSADNSSVYVAFKEAASAGIVVERTAHLTGSTATYAASGFTTTLAPGQIVVCIGTNGTDVTSVTATGLTFTRRRLFAEAASWSTGAIYTAPYTTNFSGTITVTLPSAQFTTVDIMAVSGVDSTAGVGSPPFDANVSLPGTSAAAAASGTTTSAGDFVFATIGGNNINQATTGNWSMMPGSGGVDYTITEYQVAKTAGAFTATSTGTFGSILDALLVASATTSYTMAADTGTVALAGQAATLTSPIWKLVGVGNSVEVATTAHALVTTGISGLQAGDLLVACISSRIASTTPVTLPTGGEWNLLHQQNTNNVLTTSSAVPSATMAYCVRGASDPNLTFTHPVAPSVALGRIVAYRNEKLDSPPWEMAVAGTSVVNSTVMGFVGFNAARNRDLLVAMMAGGQEAAWSSFSSNSPSGASGATDTTTQPSSTNWIERADVQTVTGADTSLAIFDGILDTAGPTGDFFVTASVAAAHAIIVTAFVKIGITNRVMSANTGTITLAGQATVLRETTVMPVPAQGVLALSGQTVAVRRSRQTAGGLGTVTLTGRDVTLTKTTIVTHYTMPAGAGTLTLAGQTPGTQYGRKMPAGLGTLALAGQAAVTRLGRKTAGGLGTVALSGQVMGLRYGRVTIASLGTLTLAGQIAALRTAKKTAGGLGTLTLTGLPPALIYSGAAKFMAAGTGGIILAGQVVTLKRNYKFPILTGTIALSGQAVNYRYTHVNIVGLGTLALSGQAAVLRYSRRTIGGQGTLTLVGQAALFPRKRVMPVTVGTITLNGQTAGLNSSSNPAKVLPAGLGTLTLAGQAATFKRNYVFPALTGTIALAGQVTTLRYGHRLVVTPGTLTIGGQDTVLRRARMGPSTLGTITLAGQVATFKRSRVMPVTFGTLTLAGQAVTLRRTVKMPAGLGTITILGPVVNLISSSSPNKTLPAGIGFIGLAGQTTTLRYARAPAAAARGTLALAGQPAQLRYGHAAVAGLGVVTLSGQPATLTTTRHLTYAMSADTGRLVIAAQPVSFGFIAQPGKMVFGRKAILRRW